MVLSLHDSMNNTNFVTMFRTFLKSQWRIIRNGRVYYVINVLGLALGIASSILILLWIMDERGYEKMHQRADRIFQLYKTYRMGEELEINESLPMPLAPSLESEFPEISHAVRVVADRRFVKYGDQVYNEKSICAADPAYFQVFSFSFIQGDPETSLDEPYSLVLTEGKAKKYFGQEDPMGKTVLFDGRDEYTVTGVMENIDLNTGLDYEMVVPFGTVYRPGSANDHWYSHFISTYIYLETEVPLDTMQARLTRHVRSHMEKDATLSMIMQPISEKHLNDPTAKSPRRMYVSIFSLIGFLVLLIACINFTNLSTFVSLKRSREIGVRKINGGRRPRLIFQFYGETFHQALAGFILAMMLVELVRPQFNNLTGKSITIPYLEPWFMFGCLGLLFLTTLLAGTYPALLISAFKPIDAFHGRIVTGKGQARLRTFLLVFQFAISVGLIITTLTIYGQLGYMQKKNLGFEKENLLYLPLEAEIKENFEVFREKLTGHARIRSACMASSLPTSVWNIVRGFTWEELEEDKLSALSFISGDFDLVKTLGLEVIQGRDFHRDFPADSSRILVNEEAARLMGYPNPVGQSIHGDTLEEYEIIGMFRDFHGLPLTEPIEPMVIFMWPSMYYFTLVRIAPGDPGPAVKHIEEVWKSLYPDIPLEYGFMDARIERQYRSESRVGRLAGAFTVLAILITCIGLFATAGHSAKRREKEIGIRKAMGASSRSVLAYFVLQYARWILLANLLAWPVSWWLMKHWLEHFAYRISLGAGSFLLATAISLLIALLTIGWHAWSTARTNPVEALMYE